MAIINSYPGITPTAEDLLLICDTSVEGNPTKTASVNSVLALIPSGSGGGGIANITSSNSNFLTVTNPDGPLVTLNVQTGFVASGGNTLATTGDIYTFTTTQITDAINALPTGVTSFACDISNIPAFTSNVTTSSAGSTTLTISRTGGSANQFLDYTGNWSTPSVQGMTDFEITADTGGSDKVVQGDKINFVGKGKISTEFVTQSSIEYEILITHDSQAQTNTTPSTTLTNGGTFTALSANVGVDGDGHVTGQTLTTYTLPTNAINSISVTSPVTNTGTSSDPVIGVDLSSKQDVITLTNTGTSGAATLVGSTLNIPIYSGGGGGSVSSVGLTMPTAFSVANSPVTGSDTLAVTVTGGAAGEFLDYTGNWSTPAGTGTDLSNVPGTSSILLESSSGTNTTLPAAITTAAGVMTATAKTRVNQLIITTSSETALGPSPINTSSNTLTLPWQGASSQVVLGDGSLQTLSTIPGTYTWTIEGDTGGPTSVASGNAIDITGGTNITTALVGTTLTINSSAGGGTVEQVDVGDTTFISGATVSGNPITSTGTLQFSLRATGSPNSNTFLSGNGNGQWTSLNVSNVFQTGKGLTTDTSTTPDTVEVDYLGANNVILKATAGSTSLERTDEVIVNIQKLSNTVQKITIEDLLSITGFAPPTYFSVKADGSMNNNGNWARNTQGFGTITSQISSTETSDIVISFTSRTSTSTDYMVNFTISGVTVVGSDNYSAGAYILTKTATSFTIRFTKPETGKDQGLPTATNFILYN